MTGSFRDAELEGWDRKAGYWDDSLGSVTLGAIDPLLEAVIAAPGVRVLDIACGTGALAAAAARRGAEIIGMDFAPTMIAEATRRHPGIDFRVGDAEAIPFPDASMDAVTCSFGMLHMERAERVLAEIARVLRPVTGRFTMTSWMPDGDFFALVGQSVQAHADTGVPLPPAPPIFRFGDEPQNLSENSAAARSKLTDELRPFSCLTLVRLSPFGTNLKCRDVCFTAAIGGKAEVTRTSSNG